MLTTVDGRFDLALPARGAVELRVQDGAGYGAIRQRLPDVAALPPVLDVGDLVLSGPIDVVVELTGPAGCDLHAVGPIGSPGIAAVVAARLRIGRHRLVLPEAGRWLLSASCVGIEHDVVPAWVTVEPDQATSFLQLQVSGGS